MVAADRSDGRAQVPGLSGLATEPLGGDLDEAEGQGHRRRLLRSEKSGEAVEPFTQASWEELFPMEGEATRKSDAVATRAPADVTRPPGTPPSETGSLVMAVRCVADRAVGTGAPPSRSRRRPDGRRDAGVSLSDWGRKRWGAA